MHFKTHILSFTLSPDPEDSMDNTLFYDEASMLKMSVCTECENMTINNVTYNGKCPKLSRCIYFMIEVKQLTWYFYNFTIEQ